MLQVTEAEQEFVFEDVEVGWGMGCGGRTSPLVLHWAPVQMS